SVAAAARRLDAHPLALRQRDADRLGRERRRVFPIALYIEEPVDGAGCPAGDPWRRKAPALAEQEYLGLLLQRLDFVDRAEAAAMTPGAAAVGAQRPAGEQHRIGRFEDLDRRNARGRDRRVAVVESIAFRVSAMAAAEEGEHHPAPAVAAMA